LKITIYILIAIILTFSNCLIKSNQQMENMVNEEIIEVKKLADYHWQTYTNIIINAPIEKVWKVLTDWNNYSKWSSTLVEINGDIRNKGNVVVSYKVKENIYNTPHIFIYKELEEFGWSYPMENSFIGLKDNHRFRVEKISENQTLFIQTDDFKGLGNPEMTSEKLANITVKFFPTFNRELKIEVEK